MKKALKLLIYILIIFLIIFTGAILFDKIKTTGLAITNTQNYTYTRAICNSENECLDVLITCEGGRVKDIQPGSKILKQSENWIDPRPANAPYC